MALKIYPPRNEQGDPQGSTPDPDSTTDVRFWVEASMRDGEVVSVLPADRTMFADVVDLLCQILTEQRKMNMHLMAGSDIDPSGEE